MSSSPSQPGLDSSKVYFYEGDENTEVLIYDSTVDNGAGSWMVYKLGIGATTNRLVVIKEPTQSMGQLATLANLAPRAPEDTPAISNFINFCKEKEGARRVVGRDDWQKKIDELKDDYSKTPPLVGSSSQRQGSRIVQVKTQADTKPGHTRNVLKKPRPSHPSA